MQGLLPHCLNTLGPLGEHPPGCMALGRWRNLAFAIIFVCLQEESSVPPVLPPIIRANCVRSGGVLLLQDCGRLPSSLDVDVCYEK